MPKYAFVFMVFTMATIGLPGTAGFVGEFLVLAGAFKASTWVAFLAATGLVLGAAYSLWLYRRVVFGELTKPDLKKMTDLSAREIAIFAPILVVVFWMGIWPDPFLKVMAVSVDNLIEQHHAALDAGRKLAALR